MKRKIIVFGATGEIGGRIANIAIARGHQVYGITRGANSRPTVDLSGVHMIQGDKNDPAFLEELGKKLDYDAVVDSVPKIDSVDHYHKFFPKAENVLFCSSTGTFVPLLRFPADETHPWRDKTAVNFYEQCLRDAKALEYYQQYGFPITILRPSNIIGQDRVPLELWGARDIEFYRKLKKSEPVVLPEGVENVMVQSGYNWDLASAFVLALEHPDAVRGEIFIISCKRAIKLGRYLETAMDYLGSKSELAHMQPELLHTVYPAVTMKYRLDFLMLDMCLDISKAERVLGYAPTHTVEEGLIEALTSCEKRGIL